MYNVGKFGESVHSLYALSEPDGSKALHLFKNDDQCLYIQYPFERFKLYISCLLWINL